MYDGNMMAVIVPSNAPHSSDTYDRLDDIKEEVDYVSSNKY